VKPHGLRSISWRNGPWRFVLAIIAVFIYGPTGGCSAESSMNGTESASSQGSGNEDPRVAQVHRMLLANLAEHVILPTYRQFNEAAESLELAAQSYAQSMTAEDLLTVQHAWNDAMDIWQRAEVIQVGPAAAMNEALGGEDLRSEIYSWPTVNPCRVDQELLEAAYTHVDTFAGELTNVRGLDALEYLLYGSTDENSCKPNSAINQNGDWQEVIDTGEIPARRAAYAQTLATLLLRDATTLLTVWEQQEDGFLEALTTAGAGSEVYPMAQDALNAVSDAMFYVDTQTKDMKLAIPTGIAGCDENICADDLESLYAHRSKEHVLQNLLGLQALLLGSFDAQEDIYGLDDLLVEMGNESLTTAFQESLVAAIDAMQAIDGTLQDALAANLNQVVAAYEAVKTVTDLLKTEFIGTLDLELPNRAAGDND
jgi:predicted lipoprotein